MCPPLNETIAPKDLHELRILEHFEHNPDATQADLAGQLGVAIGTVNWYVKRLITKGYVKVSHLQRRRLRYLITPQGFAEKTRLALQYVQVSMHMYRNARRQAQALLAQLREAGYAQVRIEGDGDLADVCRLTSIEQSFHIASSAADGRVPALKVSGTSVTLELPPAR